MKKYLISYTVHDGEAEYRQLALIEGLDEQSAENEANKIIQKGGYDGDYRIYEIESVTPLRQEQLEVIKELGLAYKL